MYFAVTSQKEDCLTIIRLYFLTRIFRDMLSTLTAVLQFISQPSLAVVNSRIKEAKLSALKIPTHPDNGRLESSDKIRSLLLKYINLGHSDSTLPEKLFNKFCGSANNFSGVCKAVGNRVPNYSRWIARNGGGETGFSELNGRSPSTNTRLHLHNSESLEKTTVLTGWLS